MGYSVTFVINQDEYDFETDPEENEYTVIAYQAQFTDVGMSFKGLSPDQVPEELHDAFRFMDQNMTSVITEPDAIDSVHVKPTDEPVPALQ